MQFKYVLRFWGYVDCLGDDECWEWLGTRDAWGRGVLSVIEDGKKRVLKAPRIAFFLEHGRWPEPNANHHCDNPACCNVRHIYEGTQAENVADQRQRARTRRGTDHHRAKLTPDDVALIRQLSGSGYGQSPIAGRFGVSRETIRAVLRGKTWTHVPGDNPPPPKPDVAGEKCATSKLAAEAVLTMRAASSGGESLGSLARRYGISKTQVSRIVNRLAWGHLP